ncbi:hypothetical protein BKA67DRAFT_576722 [Truncatella angustata]|uniref:Zn(2)-C6 fungal-type domain-containing protein n=1 Tax=Truncatella angustata TaxID=152316 RepID=A0A9P8ZUI3_9PEZI|nr:uncharacterized protein BKA67DRAFT_576722 [Truncatella angustata]KAH6649087.1 hypothetical protein BKA67DRAFT_576722 [Truncatella angustata]
MNYVSIFPRPRPEAELSTKPCSYKNTLKRKRSATQVACNACRMGKVRCDGSQPVCGRCRKRSAKCVYNDRLEMSHDAVEVLELMQVLPQQTASQILSLLRTTDPASILSIVKGGMDGKRSPSVQDAVHAVAASSSSPLELELIARNPASYVFLHQVSVTKLEASDLLRPTHLSRVCYQGQMCIPLPYVYHPESLRSATNRVGLMQTPVKFGSSSFSSSKIIGAANIAAGRDIAPSRNQASVHCRPQQSVQLCDDRLGSLRIGFWTDIPIDSDFAARIISLYLETDHPLLGIFDPDCFVSDLVSHQHTSCSSFLVNALLSWSCQMYSAIDKVAEEYARQFCAKAERLWTVEKNCDSLLNMAGAQLLSLASMANGKDYRMLDYTKVAIQMGTRLGLFGLEENSTRNLNQDMSESLRSASSFTAWGIFNWTVLTTLFYQQPGTDCPRYPPTLPIPGHNACEDYRDLSFDGDSHKSNVRMPHYMGMTFPAACQFWRILHEVSLTYLDPRNHLNRHRLSLGFAELKYREILAWAENLPSPLIQKGKNPHHVVILHIWLHAAILDIFRPFLKRPDFERLHLKTFSAPRSTPAAAYCASVNQLKHLIIYYRCVYESSSYTMLWHTALTYVANAVLQDTNDPQWWLYFLLCIYGYESLCRSFRVSQAIGRGLLTMALRDRDTTVSSARKVIGELRERGLGHNQGTIQAKFMADLELAVTDPRVATVEYLAEDFEGLAFFREFTNSVDGNRLERDWADGADPCSVSGTGTPLEQLLDV